MALLRINLAKLTCEGSAQSKHSRCGKENRSRRMKPTQAELGWGTQF